MVRYDYLLLVKLLHIALYYNQYLHKQHIHEDNTLQFLLNPFYNYLLGYDEFVEAIKQELENHYQSIKEIIAEKTSEVLEKYSNSFTRNYDYWGYYERLSNIETWQGQVKYLKNWLNGSLDYMYEYYCNNN